MLTNKGNFSMNTELAQILEFAQQGSLNPDTQYPVTVELASGDRIKIRCIQTGCREELEAVMELEKAAWGTELAFTDDYIKRDYTMFPGLQVGAFCEKTGALVGVVSAMRLSPDPAEDVDEFVAMAGTKAWEYIYAHNRDPQGIVCEGSDLAVAPEWQKKGVASVLLPFMLRQVAKTDGITRFTWQSRTPGYAKWAAENGEESGPESHGIYVNKVLAGELTDPVLSVYAGFVNAGNIDMINPNSPWLHDEASGGFGARFDATKFLKEIK